MSRPIGVFDSGVGGKSVALSLERELPDREVIFINDQKNLPYGTKSPAELLRLVRPKIIELVNKDCELIVIACNSVTTNVIGQLRIEFTVPFVGIEPMIKPAAKITKSKIIAVCATPATLASDRYKLLKNQFAVGVTVLEPDCSDWATMIESNQVDKEKVRERIEQVCLDGADVIVLGCTHYHWIEHIINGIAKGRARVIQPESAIAARVKAVLKAP